jgi:hypothetical protein
MMEVRHRGFQLAQFLLLSANVVPEIRTTPRGPEGSGRVANLSLREVGTRGPVRQVVPAHSFRSGEVGMKPESALFSYRWLNVLPGILLISLVVLFFWFLGAAAIIGSGGSIEEQAQHTLPIALARDTGQAE